MGYSLSLIDWIYRSYSSRLVASIVDMVEMVEMADIEFRSSWEASGSSIAISPSLTSSEIDEKLGRKVEKSHV